MADRQTRTHTLKFLFVGYWRDWNPVEGFEPPKGRVCELRSFPGNVVTWASTYKEAHLKMRLALDKAFTQAGSPWDWYKSARTRMSPADELERRELWERAWEENCPTKVAELPDDGTVPLVTKDVCLYMEETVMLVEPNEGNRLGKLTGVGLAPC